MKKENVCFLPESEKTDGSCDRLLEIELLLFLGTSQYREGGGGVGRSKWEWVTRF